MQATDCTKCGGSGFLESGDKVVKCSCLVTKELKAYLPKIFEGDKIAKKFTFTSFAGKNITAKGTIRRFGSLVNTLLTHHYLRDPKFTYSIVGYTTFVEQFFDGDVAPHYEADLLILLVYGGYQHSKVEEYVNSLLKDRELNRRPTLVFIDKDFSDKLLRDRLGESVVSIVTKFTAVNI